MAELVYAGDSKSPGFTTLWVRVPLSLLFLKLWINSVISKTLEFGWAITAVYYFFNGIIETGILCLILSSIISIQRNLTPKK